MGFGSIWHWLIVLLIVLVVALDEFKKRRKIDGH